MNDLSEISSVAEVATDRSLLTVAFASSDGECVNQHFGSSRGFYVFYITTDNSSLIASKSFPKEKKDGNEDKLKPKLSWLHGSDIVYCGSVGGSATRQLITLGAHPVVVKGGPDIEEIIEDIQKELKGIPSPLIQRVMQNKEIKSDARFDNMDEEGWDE